MKIGIIGCGNIGGTLAKHWAKAGHQVIISSRDLKKCQQLAKSIGANASAGTPLEAIQKSDVVLLSIPLGETPKLSKDIIHALKGKVVLDTTNPYPDRDGKCGEEALGNASGSGAWTSKHLPGAKIVKAFNTVYYKLLQSEANRKKEPIGVPIASDDEKALHIAEKLVKDAGFGPVIVGELRRCKEFDNGTEPYASGASVNELHEMFGHRAHH